MQCRARWCCIALHCSISWAKFKCFAGWPSASCCANQMVPMKLMRGLCFFFYAVLNMALLWSSCWHTLYSQVQFIVCVSAFPPKVPRTLFDYLAFASNVIFQINVLLRNKIQIIPNLPGQKFRNHSTHTTGVPHITNRADQMIMLLAWWGKQSAAQRRNAAGLSF